MSDTPLPPPEESPGLPAEPVPAAAFPDLDSSNSELSPANDACLTLAPRPQGPIARFFLDATNRLRTPFRLFLFIVVLAVLLVGLQIDVFLALVAGLLWQEVPLGEVGPRILQLADTQPLALQFFLAGPTVLVTLVVLELFRRQVDRRTLMSSGFVPVTARRVGLAGFGLVIGGGVIAAGAFFAWAAGQYVASDPAPIGWVWWSLLPTLILMAFFEEIVFRGYLLQNFRDIGWPVTGVVISSVLFWLVHSFNPAAWSTVWIGVNLFGAGVALSLAYMASGDIWFPTAVHFAWNYMQAPLLGIPVSGMETESLLRIEPRPDIADWISGGGFGLEGSAVCIPLNLVLCAIFGAMIWRQSAGKIDASLPADER
ncbi:CPBP family intramembrane glutamic endopeptidase [Lignipirellula cremea]|uniref:CAAX amino terminal protease self-immunity n=1 Tax=Lignipirellula cremea TaxID=2528010 RepID=A0A518E0F2_9BACT|nr:CPBP family intramembrane glutamic endopeptidase [Lignipirellula cremea]QDU97567.1 CAAX amino terminal protease self- immunity [Lignipirellula cremea]